MEPTIESLEHEVKTEHDLYLRALADFENYRRRVEREKSQLGREALRRFILPLLDVIDDLERLLKFAEAAASPLADRIRDVHAKLLKILDIEGIRPFGSVGQPFDPSIHDAVATQPAGERPPGTVVEEVRRGYRWDDEALRPARVVVAS
jgi:molecular chaperone GrpE